MYLVKQKNKEKSESIEDYYSFLLWTLLFNSTLAIDIVSYIEYKLERVKPHQSSKTSSTGR